MNEYEITIGLFNDGLTYTDCEQYTVLADSLVNAATAAAGIKFRTASYRTEQKREIIRIRRVK